MFASPTSDHPSDTILNEYLDMVLPPETRAEVETHLAACSDCAARLTALRALFASLKSLPELPLQRDLTPDVLAAIQPTAAPSPALRLAAVFQTKLEPSRQFATC